MCQLENFSTVFKILLNPVEEEDDDKLRRKRGTIYFVISIATLPEYVSIVGLVVSFLRLTVLVMGE